jgi:peptidoglycan DL-endopeptidase CwlO
VAIPPMPPRTRYVRRALVLVAATSVAIAGLLASGLPAQAKPSPTELKSEISTLNNQIEVNGEKYNGAQVALTSDQQEQTKLGAQIGPLQLQAAVADQQLGTLAAQLYMSGASHTTLEALVNASSTQAMLDEMGAVNEMARGQKVAIAGASAQVAAYGAKKKKQDALVIKDKELVASLTATKKTFDAQLASLKKLQDAEDASTGSGTTSGGGGSGASKFSHSYVTDGGKACPQTSGSGKGHTAAVKACSLLWPVHMYRLTADGPTYYDCSGLTMVAWRAAGVSLDHWTGDGGLKDGQLGESDAVRTSSSSGLSVGDLVFYNTGHHVAIYVGNGYVVQAEQTGQPVKLSPVNFETIWAVGHLS